MKKAFSIIALCMAIILCIPSVHSYAFDTDNLFARTKQSVTGYWTDSTQDHIQKCVTSLDRSNVNAIATKVANLSTFGGAGDTFSKTYYAVFYWSDSGYIMVYSFDDSGNPFIFCPDSIDSNTNAVSRYRICKSQVSSMNAYAIGLSDNSFSEFSGSVSSENGVYVRDWSNGTLLCTNIPVYVFNDTQTINLLTIQSSQETYTNYFPQDLPYLNEDGDIVRPAPDYSFGDTTYNGGIAFNYQQTHLYTEYNNAQGANETCVFKWALDSRSQSITQTTGDWQMHYYVVVNWHWTQATDSSVYTPLLSGGSGGQMAFEFDDTPEFIMQGKSKISIWDLVQNVPTVSSVRDEDIVSLAVAVSCLNGNIVNSVWRDIFGQSGQYVSNVASEIISGGKLEVQGVGEVGGDFLNNLFNPAYYYALDDLRVNLVAHPWSKTLGIHGGNGDFDLNLRSNESYGTTQGYVDDGGTPDNPSDDTQYPTNTVPQQNNVVVPVTYPTSGGNVTVYSVVQVPDSGGGSSNSINYSPTFSPSIVMDSGLDDLKETVDAYPQVPNQHFWDYFLVFKDNAFLDATSDFFGALPSELSSLLISSIGIIGVFAIYRFVRRR